MRKIFFTAALAIGSFVAVNAQVANTYNPPPAPCCDYKVDFDLKVEIEPIICLWPNQQPTGYVEYDCRTDFDSYQQFENNDGGQNDWDLNVWSNMKFDINLFTTDQNFEYFGSNFNQNLSTSNVQWTVKNAATPGLTSFVNAKGTYVDLPYFASIGAGAGFDNVISEHNPTYGQFELQFRMKPLANAWNYGPGLYKADVYVTATVD